MFRNYLKIAWRSLLKDKQFTVLNVLGLSAGLASSLLIFLWVRDEASFDKFFQNDDRLYRLLEGHSNAGEKIIYGNESSGKLSEAVKQSHPEVEFAAAVAPAKWFAPNTLSVNDKNLKATCQYAEKDYFNIFSFPLLEGNKNQVLQHKSDIVISDELAIKLFGTTEGLLGKAIQFDHDTTFNVSGIFKKMPANSSEQFDFVLSFDYFRTVKDWVNHWNGSGPQNFVLLKKGTAISQFNKKVEGIVTRHTGDTARKVTAMRFSDGYLHNAYDNDSKAGERIEYVRMFMGLAAFILIIACINFMNLSTAKAARRLKEVGIKKVVGARRSQLVVQFLVESLLLTVFAMVVALVLAIILLPEFNHLTGKSIVLNFSWEMVVGILAIALMTGFFAGSYPALYISGFNPLAILKGKLRTSTAELLSRKGLVVFQFSISTILIVAVTVIHKQIQFIRDADTGYNKENIVRLNAEGGLQTNQESFLSAMQRIPGVVNAGYTFHNIVGRKYSDVLDWPGESSNDEDYFEVFGVNSTFIETMGMQMKNGRGFSKDFRADSLNIVINESAVRAMNLKNPIGTIVRFHGTPRQIVGVVRDFHFESMHEAIKPSFMHLQKGEGTIVARIKQENQRQTISGIENLYKKYNPGFPFTFNFLDEAYQKQYQTETLTGTLSGYFSGLAIIISCLGLFGLTAFMAQKRRKEISIRKVIGAPIAGIIALLSKDFLKLVCISLLIAFPISWWLMKSWLQGYAYRISLSPTIFLLVGMFVMIISLMVIGFQTVKAAIANPVKSMRTE